MVLRAAMIREYFGRAFFGRLLGIIMGAGSIGGIIGPTLAGWTFDTFGSYYLIWYGYAVLLCIGVILMLISFPTESGYHISSPDPPL